MFLLNVVSKKTVPIDKKVVNMPFERTFADSRRKSI
jgi:hypothetical protein